MKNVYVELQDREKQNQNLFKNTINEMEEKVIQQNDMAQENIRNLVNTQKELN